MTGRIGNIDGMRGYTGRFSSGKTLNMTKDLYDLYCQGDTLVITNYETAFSHLVILKRSEFLRLLLELFIAKDQKNSKLFGDYTRIAIGLDEGGIYFNAYQWQKLEKEFSSLGLDIEECEITPEAFFLQLSKMGIQIFYTVQQPQFMNVTFRRLTSEWYIQTPIIKGLALATRGIIPPDSPSIEKMEPYKKSFVWTGEQHAWQLYDTTELVKYIQLNNIDIGYNVLTDIDLEKKYQAPSFFSLNFPNFIKIFTKIFSFRFKNKGL